MTEKTVIMELQEEIRADETILADSGFRQDIRFYADQRRAIAVKALAEIERLRAALEAINARIDRAGKPSEGVYQMLVFRIWRIARNTLGLPLPRAAGVIPEDDAPADSAVAEHAPFSQISPAGKMYLKHTADGRVFCEWLDGRFVEVVEKPHAAYDERLKQVSLATVDAKLMGCGFLMLLPNGRFEHIPLDRIQVKPEESSPETVSG